MLKNQLFGVEQHLLIQNQIATTHARLLIRQLANGKL